MPRPKHILVNSIYVTNDEETELITVSQSRSSYEIPASIETIADGTDQQYAFKLANSMSFRVTFAKGSSIRSIGTYAFYSCTNLLSIDFTNANKLTIINSHAFSFCRSLTTVELPASLSSIEFYGAFSNCNRLTTVTFKKESSLQLIDGGAFSGTGLTTIEIPKSCRAISASAFTYTPIRDFFVEEGNEYFNVYNGSLYSLNFNTLICHQKATPLLIHSSTTTIGSQSFAGFSYDAIIPTQIKTFSGWTFLGFNGNSLTIMSDIDTINERMFECSGNLKEVRFLGKVNHISKNAFSSGSGIQTIYFLYPVQSVSVEAFAIDITMICFAWNVQNLKKMLQPTELLTCNMSPKHLCTQQHMKLIRFYPKLFILLLQC